jgi:hypothetical protein
MVFVEDIMYITRLPEHATCHTIILTTGIVAGTYLDTYNRE